MNSAHGNSDKFIYNFLDNKVSLKGVSLNRKNKIKGGLKINLYDKYVKYLKCDN